MKPDDIPQGAWDVASRIYPCHPNDGFGYSLRSDIARAIMAEREACALLAEQSGGWAGRYNISHAIRSRP